MSSSVPRTRPAERYDAVPESRSVVSGRAVALLLIGLIAALVAAGGYTIMQYMGTPEISGQESGFVTESDSLMHMRVDVTRDEPSTPVYCIVRAKEYSGGEVGRREIYVPPSDQRTVRIDTTIETIARGFVPDVYGCGSDIPAYLRR